MAPNGQWVWPRVAFSEVQARRAAIWELFRIFCTEVQAHCATLWELFRVFCIEAHAYCATLKEEPFTSSAVVCRPIGFHSWSSSTSSAGMCRLVALFWELTSASAHKCCEVQNYRGTWELNDKCRPCKTVLGVQAYCSIHGELH